MNPTYGRSKDGALQWVRLQHSGFNGFLGIPGAPEEDITYDLTFYFDPTGNVVVKGRHDGYPSYEIYVYRDGESPTILWQWAEMDIGKLASPADIPVAAGTEDVKSIPDTVEMITRGRNR